MSNATGSRVQLLRIAEVTYAVTPATPAMTATRITGHTLDVKRAQLQSGEIRSDGQIADFRLGNYNVEGDINSELIYGDFDDMFACLLKGAWTTEASGTPNTLVEAVTKQSFSFESGNLDIANIYRMFTGVYVDSLQLDVQPGKIVSCKWGMKGSTMTQTTSTGAGSVVAASTNSPMDSFTGTISEGGSSIAYVSGLKLDIKNDDSDGPVVGSKFSIDFFPGRLSVSGTLSAYVPSGVLLAKYLNETNSSLSFVLSGLPNTKTLTFLLPKIRYTSGTLPLSNEKAQIQTLGFQALLDVGGTGETIKLTRSNP